MHHNTRRKFARAPIHVTVACTVDGERISGTLWQISEGGVFLELPSVDDLPPSLAVDFDLPGHGTHRVVIKPVWHCHSAPRALPEVHCGAGCEFSVIEQKTRDAVAAYVKKVKQTYSMLQFELALLRPSPKLPRLLEETGLKHLADGRAVKEAVSRTISQLQTTA